MFSTLLIGRWVLSFSVLSTILLLNHLLFESLLIRLLSLIICLASEFLNRISKDWLFFLTLCYLLCLDFWFLREVIQYRWSAHTHRIFFGKSCFGFHHRGLIRRFPFLSGSWAPHHNYARFDLDSFRQCGLMFQALYLVKKYSSHVRYFSPLHWGYEDSRLGHTSVIYFKRLR